MIPCVYTALYFKIHNGRVEGVSPRAASLHPLLRTSNIKNLETTLHLFKEMKSLNLKLGNILP